MPKIIIDARNIPATININQLIAGIQTLPLDVALIVEDECRDMGIERVEICNMARVDENYLDAVDIFLTLNPKIRMDELNKMFKKGVVPVLHKDFASMGFKEFKPIEEEGNSFIFDNWNEWAIFATLVRSLENYQFPYDWSNIIHAVKNIEVELD